MEQKFVERRCEEAGFGNLYYGMNKWSIDRFLLMLAKTDAKTTDLIIQETDGAP
jgi:hypothetical protein